MDQHQQLQQLQQLQQHQPQPQHFIPIQVPTGVSKNKIATNVKTNPNAALGFSSPVNNNTTSPVPAPALIPALTPVPIAVPATSPLIGMVQDVVIGMILHVPALRTKLQSILDNPSLIAAEISKVHDELQTKLTPNELTQLNSYACQDSSRRTIGSVMQTAFANIMADGKIDMNDAPHFLTLIHDCITLFATEATNSNAVALNSNTVITFLHFVLKCILILTLDGPEEDAALVMLDSSFMLVKLTVMPLIAGKKWCSCFS